MAVILARIAYFQIARPRCDGVYWQGAVVKWRTGPWRPVQTIRMSDSEEVPRPELPPCSVPGCLDAAGVIIDGKHLCFEHATEVANIRSSSSESGHHRWTPGSPMTFGKRGGGGRRSAPREAAPLLAVYTTVTKSHEVVLVDVSSSGALLRGPNLPEVGDELFVSVENIKAFGTVARVDEHEFAIAFDRRLSAEDLAIPRSKINEGAGFTSTGLNRTSGG